MAVGSSVMRPLVDAVGWLCPSRPGSLMLYWDLKDSSSYTRDTLDGSMHFKRFFYIFSTIWRPYFRQFSS